MAEAAYGTPAHRVGQAWCDIHIAFGNSLRILHEINTKTCWARPLVVKCPLTWGGGCWVPPSRTSMCMGPIAIAGGACSIMPTSGQISPISYSWRPTAWRRKSDRFVALSLTLIAGRSLNKWVALNEH